MSFKCDLCGERTPIFSADINGKKSIAGWYPIGIACWILAGLLLLFPRMLPRAAMRRSNLPEVSKKLSLAGN